MFKILPRLLFSIKLSAFPLLVGFTLSVPGKAATVTVRKLKGKQAVIETNALLEEGKTYTLGGDSLVLDANPVSSHRSRYNSITLNIDLGLINGNRTVENIFTFGMRYGWNYSAFEVGPVLNLEVYDKGFGTNTNYLIGGYIDYNYVENKNAREFLYGPSLQFLIGNRNFEDGGTAQLTQAQVSAFATWFINQSPVALKSELGYVYRQVNSANANTNLTGVQGKMYLLYYF